MVNTYYKTPPQPSPTVEDQHRRYLRSVIDAIPHYIFARDADGYFTLVNQAVADFYGLSVQELEGRHLRDIHPDPEQVRAFLDEDRHILEIDEQQNQPLMSITDADGQQFWIEAIKRPLPTEPDDRPQVLGVSIDITEQKRAEAALARRLDYEHTAAALFQTFLHCGVGELDGAMSRVMGRLGRFAEATRAFLYRLDTPDDDARLLYRWAQNDADDVRELPPAVRRQDLEWLLGLFEMKVPVMTENLRGHTTIPPGFLDLWGDGPTAFVAAPVLSDGKLFGFIGVDVPRVRTWQQEEINLLHSVADLFITVWSKHRTERSLVEATKVARASNRAKSEFLANMSHEIRTPMNCIIGLADLLTEMEPTARQRQYLEMIRMSGASLLTLINDILDLSKIEAGQLELDLVPTELPELIADVTGLIAFTAQSRGLEMVVRLAPGVPTRVMIDPCRLRQVLTNLLNNAAKFTQHGHIYLNIEPVGTTDGGTDLRFQVSDTGIGIAQENLDRIFEKFTQAEAGTTRRFGGTGLGLSISQQLVELMGGRISATSRPGAGSTFQFTMGVEALICDLPLARNDDLDRVLVVSGHELTGQVLVEQLDALGHEAQLLVGGPDMLDQAGGWASADERPYGLILYNQNAADDTLPNLRPYLARLAPKHTPRAVLLTNLSSLVQDEELENCGFVGTLPKPVAPTRLARVLAGNTNLARVTGTTPVPSAPVPADPIADPGPATGSPLVLLAEDNPFNQQVAKAMLRLLGCRVQVAATGVEAVDMARGQTYDLILMDCQMPLMDGYEATRRIRQLPGDAGSVTIIAMTANALSGDRDACFSAGMDDFLGKPITKAMLARMLEKWEIATVAAD